jgi:hypothetical protein
MLEMISLPALIRVAVKVDPSGKCFDLKYVRILSSVVKRYFGVKSAFGERYERAIDLEA